MLLAQGATFLVAAENKEPTTLPVYEVVKTGATAEEAEALARRLGIPSKQIRSESGAIEFVETTRFLSFPKEEKVAESKRLEEAIAATRNKDATRNITPTILRAGASYITQ